MEKVIPLYMLSVIGCVLFVALKSVISAKDWKIGPEESQLYPKRGFNFLLSSCPSESPLFFL